MLARGLYFVSVDVRDKGEAIFSGATGATGASISNSAIRFCNAKGFCVEDGAIRTFGKMCTNGAMDENGANETGVAMGVHILLGAAGVFE